MRYLLAGLCCVLGALQALAALPPDTPRTDMWIPNGTQNAWVKHKDKLFVGGDFTMWGQHSGGLVRTDAQTGELLHSWPNLTGELHDFRPDGVGGLFVAGSFYDSNTGTLHRLIRITPDGQVDTNFSPTFNGLVRSILIDGSVLYAVGDFTVVNGQTRNYICALNIPSGTNTAWDPNANALIKQMHLLGSTLYVHGSFTNIGGQARTRMAALDTTANTNNALAWDPSPDGTVTDFLIDNTGTTMYVTGNFSNIGGQNVPSIARISTTGPGSADGSWNPAVTGLVNSIAFYNGVLYCGGSFTSLGGAARMYMGAINVSTQTATGFDPALNGVASRLQRRGNKLFTAGSFTQIGGQRIPFNVCFDLDAGALDPWRPGLGIQARKFRAQGDNVLVCGAFNLAGGKWSRGIACIDIESGTLSDNFDYELSSGSLHDFVIHNDILYLGGSFSAINGNSRNNAAAINLTNGNITPWAPNFNGEIRRMINDGRTLYAGGGFTTVNGQARTHLAAVSLTSNTVLGWTPNPDGFVHELNLVDGRLLVGGNFGNIGGVNSAYFAAVNPDTTGSGNHVSWAPAVDARVRTIHATKNHVLIGGDFSTVGGQARGYLSMLNRNDGSVQNLTLNTNGPVRSIKSVPGYLLIAGDFSTIDGHPIKGLAAYSLTTNSIDTGWITRPSLNQGIRRLLTVGRTLYVSAAFTDSPYVGNFRAFQSGVMEPSNIAEIPGSELAADYKMICLSHRTDSTKPVMQSLVQRFGPYDITRWRLYRWAAQSQQYFEGPDIPGITSNSPVLHPAFGYWILARNSIFVNFDAGISPYEDIIVPIYPGWNMIGNPFPETLEAINDPEQRLLQVRSATSRWRSLTGNQPWLNSNILRWQNNTYEPITNWKAFRGAWINNTSNETVFLRMRGPAG